MVLLGLTALYHLFNVTLYSPPNIFRTLSLPADCPNFILHQSWKRRAELDPGFMDMYPDSMRERFKAMENRLVYEVYGQDAFLNCEHCTERSDYLLYLTPGALASYVGMAVILGIATTQTSHLNKYRTWGSAALVLLAIIEYGTYQKGAEIVSLPSLKLKGTLVGYRGAHLIRHGFLAMMSVVMTGLLLRATGGRGVRDEVEILNDLCQAQEVMIQRHRALQLARVASLRDPALRTQFVEYWRSREVEYGLLLADKDFKEAREQARSRIDVAAVMQEADEYIDAIMKAGERQAEGTSSSTAPDENLTRVGQEMAPLHLGTN
ncbi:hypothetical protein BGX34_012164 [Mortierella sp. NVP85]|nr:hypothetical protein BGX34_012164 [Mortierella sp. NVP85]